MTDIVKRLRHIADLWEPDEKSSIQLEAAAEIERLRAAIAARTEECARMAGPGARELYSQTHGAWDRGYTEGRKHAAAAIRALPSPSVQDTSKQEGGE